LYSIDDFVYETTELLRLAYDEYNFFSVASKIIASVMVRLLWLLLGIGKQPIGPVAQLTKELFK